MFTDRPYPTVASRIITTPIACVDPSAPDDTPMRTTPLNPTTNPTSWGPRGRRRSITEAKIAAKIGIAPFSIPATAELMYCCAIGKRVNGMPTHNTDSTSTRGRSAGSIGLRAAGNEAAALLPRDPPASR